MTSTPPALPDVAGMTGGLPARGRPNWTQSAPEMEPQRMLAPAPASAKYRSTIPPKWRPVASETITAARSNLDLPRYACFPPSMIAVAQAVERVKAEDKIADLLYDQYRIRITRDALETSV